MDEETPPTPPEPPPPPPPLVYAAVVQSGDKWRVTVAHPSFAGGATLHLTEYTTEEAALAGAYWWDDRVANNPPGELIDMETGNRYDRTV